MPISSPSTGCFMMKRWFCEEIITLCVLAEFISGFGAKPLIGLMKRMAFAASICILALGGFIAGSIHGSLKGQTTETGFLRGAIIGGIVGAIAGIQLLDSPIDGEPFSKVTLLRSLVNGKLFMEFVNPAMLKAYQWQVSSLEPTYGENSDIYDTSANKGLSKKCIQKLPSHKYLHSSKIHSHDFCCSICLQGLKRGESIRRIPKCGHLFHLDCIDQWLSRQGSCPICRTNVCSDKYDNELVIGLVVKSSE